MRKEIVIVIIFGILIGSIIAYGIYTAKSALKNKTLESVAVGNQSQQQDTQSEHALQITEPEDNTVVEQEKIKLSGTTSPNSIITLIAAENEYLLTADADGNFSVEVPLVGGANNLKISSFAADGRKAETTLALVYSTAKL